MKEGGMLHVKVAEQQFCRQTRLRSNPFIVQNLRQESIGKNALLDLPRSLGHQQSGLTNDERVMCAVLQVA